MAEVEVHVAPLPPEHLARRDCPCGPIKRTFKSGGTVWVHRLGKTEVSPLRITP